MDIDALRNGIPALLMQGFLMNIEEGRDKKKVDGEEKEFPVLVLTLLQSQTKIKKGAEVPEISTVSLTVKDASTFGEFYSLIGGFISVPVGNMGTRDGGSIFWIPQGAHPKSVKVESQPKPFSSVPPSGVKSPLDKVA